ncbi:MAG: tagaturonate reductase [Bacteroidota bacterium]
MKKLNRETANVPANKPLKILQFGGGNFLRAFVDYMVDELNQNTDFNGGVLIVKPTERGDYTALRQQDGLFHVLTKGIRDGKLVDEQQLIQCVQQINHPYKNWGGYLKSAEELSIRFIVSNTTESGIQFNATDAFSDHPPKEFPAKLTHWLFHRWQYFQGSVESGCVYLPCELIEQNGQQLKRCILQYADHWQLPLDFRAWIEQHNYFCNTLVDRIVPGYPKDSAANVREKLGYQDDLLVDAEPYHIWAIEGPDFLRQELPFDKTNLNVVFTEDLQPYRQLKVRILNGAHTTMVPTGYLANIDTVRAVVEDDKMGTFIKKALYDNILPTLDFPQPQKEKYASDVLDRFKNPFIHHQLISISLNSTSKYKTRVLPSLLQYYEQFGTIPEYLATALAALIVFYRGKRGTENIPLKDSEFALNFFAELWQHWEVGEQNTSELVEKVLREKTFWEQDISQLEGLVAFVSKKVSAYL